MRHSSLLVLSMQMQQQLVGRPPRHPAPQISGIVQPQAMRASPSIGLTAPRPQQAPGAQSAMSGGGLGTLGIGLASPVGSSSASLQSLKEQAGKVLRNDGSSSHFR